MSLDADATLALQREFARHLRDPELFPPPEGLEERRLKIYRELFYNNIEGLLATNFPVMRQLLGDTRWHRLVRDFYREPASHTPLFTEIGREFQRYLETRIDAGRGDPPFLTELAHYEWVELALSLDERDIDDVESALAGRVRRNGRLEIDLHRSTLASTRRLRRNSATISSKKRLRGYSIWALALTGYLPCSPMESTASTPRRSRPQQSASAIVL